MQILSREPPECAIGHAEYAYLPTEEAGSRHGQDAEPVGRTPPGFELQWPAGWRCDRMDDRMDNTNPAQAATAHVGGLNVDLRRTALAEIIDLRHDVLRHGMPRSAAVFDGDADP